ncbi:hypothetical protein LguiA_005276 [Lonicera macranthoides]
MVKFLATSDPNICFTEDEDGWTPLHLAAKKGRVEVVNELVQARPEVMMYPLNPATAISITHSYVLCNGLEALKHLVEADHDLLNNQDGDGNTILHKVTAIKQTEPKPQDTLNDMQEVHLNWYKYDHAPLLG